MSTVTKAAKAAGSGIQSPFPFRLMHSNAEFSHGRNLRGAGHRPGAATVPEPLETLTIVMGASFKVRPVARKFLDLPGTNRTRGLNNVPLMTMDVGVTWARRCEILQGSSKTAPVDEEVPDWMDDDEDAGKTGEGEDEDKADDDEGKTGDGEGETGENEGEDEVKKDGGKTCDLYPWEHNEFVCRELLNCFGAKTVVHYNTNCSWPLACARHAINFVGFARSEVHAQHVHKTLVAMVVAEIIEGKMDGFGVRRFLSAQRSLGGSTEDGGASETKGGGGSDAAKTDGGAGAKTEGGSAGADDASSVALVDGGTGARAAEEGITSSSSEEE